MSFEFAKKKPRIIQPYCTEEEPEKKYLAALHLHTDIFTPDIDKQGLFSRHGATPKNLAKYIVNSGVDFFAITEHIQAVQGNVKESFWHFQEVCREIEKFKDNKDIIGKYGIELSMTSPRIDDSLEDEPCKYHINLIFEDDFYKADELPDLSKLHHRANFENYLKFRDSTRYKHIAILNHPSTENFSYELKGCKNTTRKIMQIVDGIEVANRRAFSKEVIPTQLFVEDILLALEAKQKNPKLSLTGSGDIHNGESECLSTFTTAYYAKNKSDLFEAIRKGKTKVDIAQSPLSQVNQRVVEIISEINRLATEGVINIDQTGLLENYCTINSQYLSIGH